MHINQMLVHCLDNTMDHSLPQVELWSIWKKSCNQPIWAQNWTNSVWLEIFRIIQNPWRIRRSCNYKSCSKLHLLSLQNFWQFFSPLSYFSRGEFSFRRLKFNWKLNRSGSTCQWQFHPPGLVCRRPPPTWHTTRHRGALRQWFKTTDYNTPCYRNPN
jgi:hypothetical protein